MSARENIRLALDLKGQCCNWLWLAEGRAGVEGGLGGTSWEW